MELKYNALELLNIDVEDFIDSFNLNDLIKEVKNEIEICTNGFGEYEIEMTNILDRIKVFKIQIQSLIASVKYAEPLVGFLSIEYEEKRAFEYAEAKNAIEAADINYEILYNYEAEIKNLMHFINVKNEIYNAPSIILTSTSKVRNKTNKNALKTEVLQENEVAKLVVAMMYSRLITSTNHLAISYAVKDLTGNGNDNVRKNIHNKKNFTKKERENILDYIDNLIKEIKKLPTQD